MTKLDAKPGPIEVELTKSAVVVVDMQNAFASKGGMLDIAGADISDAPRVVSSIKIILDAARQACVPVVYAQMGYKARSEEHTSELQSRLHLVCRLLLEKKKKHVKHMYILR